MKQEAIKEGCKDCPKAANEVPCMWGGFVGDCPYNTYKSEPEIAELKAKDEAAEIEQLWRMIAIPDLMRNGFLAVGQELIKRDAEISRLEAELKAKDKAFEELTIAKSLGVD